MIISELRALSKKAPLEWLLHTTKKALGTAPLMKIAAMENENIGGQRDKKKSNNVNRRKFYFATI